MNRGSLVASQRGLVKTRDTDLSGGILSLLALLRAVNADPRPGASILDFGCGVGNGVRTLLEMGYAAHGVDIYEYWGREADLYWELAPQVLSSEITNRLRVATLEPYSVPYPDQSFDHIVSAQVLEHVDDLGAVFGELYRLMKPGATSVHVFPGRWVPLIEGHTGVPFPVACRLPLYLKAMAWLGIRSPRQKDMNWRDVYQANSDQIKITHYPRPRAILRLAQAAGFDASFGQSDYVRNSGRGWSRLHRRLGPVAVMLGKVTLQNMLVLRRPFAQHGGSGTSLHTGPWRDRG